MRNNVNPDGTSRDAGEKDGILHRIDSAARVTLHRRGVGISNTLAWSPDGRRFYFGDTLANVIWVYDFDSATGQISNEVPFLEDFDRGLPDGSTIDYVLQTLFVTTASSPGERLSGGLFAIQCEVRGQAENKFRAQAV